MAGWLSVASATLAVTLFSATTSPAVPMTNTVPYTNTFESYSDGQTLIGIDGWYSADTNNALIIATNVQDAYTGIFPLSTSVYAHAKALKLDVLVTNEISSYSYPVYSNQANVWIDMLIKPLFWDETNSPPDTVTNGCQTALYFNSQRIHFPDKSSSLVRIAIID